MLLESPMHKHQETEVRDELANHDGASELQWLAWQFFDMRRMLYSIATSTEWLQLPIPLQQYLLSQAKIE
jgi:hypothetical protein